MPGEGTYGHLTVRTVQGTYGHLSVRTASMGHTDIIPALGSGVLGSRSVGQQKFQAAGAFGALCSGSIRNWSIMQWRVRQRQRWAERVSGRSVGQREPRAAAVFGCGSIGQQKHRGDEGRGSLSMEAA